MNPLALFLSAALFALSSLVPAALARDLTTAEAAALQTRVDAFSEAFKNNDMAAVSSVIPPKMLNAMALRFGMEPAQLRDSMAQAMEEALRVGCLNVAADAVNAAAQLEQTQVKAYSTWRRLQDLSDRLYVDSGASTPNLRQLVSSLEGLTGNQLEIPLSDIENHSVQVQLHGEAPEGEP